MYKIKAKIEKSWEKGCGYITFHFLPALTILKANVNGSKEEGVVAKIVRIYFCWLIIESFLEISKYKKGYFK